MSDRLAGLELVRHRYPRQGFEVEGRRWTYVDSGAPGAALLCLPGSQGTGEMFFPQLRDMGDSVRMIVVDYPETGGFDALACDLWRLLDRLRLATVGVLGTSFGGYLAQVMAACHPQRIDRLILANSFVDGAPFAWVFNPPGGLLALDADALHGRFSAAAAALSEKPGATGTLGALLVDQLGRQSPPALRERLLAVAGAGALAPLTVAADRITLVSCADDDVVPPAVRDAMLAHYPGARHVALDAGGHYPAILAEGAYTRAITDAVAPPAVGDPA